MKRAMISTAVFLGVLGSHEVARGSEHELYYVQAGALLNYAEAEVRVLYAAVTQRVFDPTVTKQAMDELERTLTRAKRQVGRAGTLLPEKASRHEEAIDGIRKKVIAAERQLARVREIVDTAIERLTSDETEDEGEEAAPTDWEAIRASCAWLGKDIKAARTAHAATRRRMALKPLRFPPTPRGKRPE